MKEIKKTNYNVNVLYQAMADDRMAALFHAPRGNNKLHSIPAWNLLPIVTCSDIACMTCESCGCYAVKNCLCHGSDPEKNNCLRAWTENTLLCLSDLETFREKMTGYLEKKKPEFFRIHASGDFFSEKYARVWFEIAREFPGVKFLAFTKAFDVIRGVPFYTLPNFSLVLSAWKDVTPPEDLRKFYSVAWIADGSDHGDVLHCPGNCETCGACWSLAQEGRDVEFMPH